MTASKIVALAASGGAAEVDDNFNQVVLLSHFDGTDGSDGNTFTDSSTNNLTITKNGNVRQGSFAPLGSRWAVYVDGDGDYIQLPDDTDFDLTDDFTVELFIYRTGTGTGTYQAIIGGNGSGSDGWNIYIRNSDAALIFFNDNAFRITSAASAISYNTWHHIVLERVGSSVKLYVDATQVGSTYTNSGSFEASSISTGPRIGADLAANDDFEGYISNVRIVNNDNNVYNGSVTVPTSNLTSVTGTVLLTCNSNSFYDSSSSDHTLTPNGNVKVTKFSPHAPSTAYDAAVDGASAYFDGSGDYLRTGTTSVAIGTGDFTMEAWVYPDGASGDCVVFDTRSGTASNRPVINYDSNKFRYYANKGFRITSSAVYYPNAWHHVALVRSSGTSTLYLNGVSEGTYADTTDYGTATRFEFAADDDGSENAYFKGYLSDARFVDSAVYTSAFTPPTAPLSAITNTEVLLNFADAAMVDQTGINNIEAVDITIETDEAKFGSASLFNDGDRYDYAIIKNKPELDFTLGSWTVEAWIYPTDDTYAKYNTILTKRQNGSSNTEVHFYLSQSTGYVSFYNGSNYESTTKLTVNQWSHVAWVYNGTTLKIYVNGTSVKSSSVGITSRDEPIVIGATLGYDEALSGYIDDLRVTMGVERYTTTFTPPDKAFPDQ